METVKIKVRIRTNKVGSLNEDTIEIPKPKEEWENMTEEEKGQEMLDTIFDGGMAEWSYEEIDKKI